MASVYPIHPRMPKMAAIAIAAVIFIKIKSIPVIGGKNNSHRYTAIAMIETAMSRVPIN